jgi:hypothetical protein
MKIFAQQTIQIGTNGRTVDIENSDSVDDNKMPAQISRKKTKKVTEPMDTDSSKEMDG